jgi:ribosomal protein L16 Arg81 hydroxylase
MEQPELSFEQMLHPIRFADFQENYWEQQTLHIERNGDNPFTGVFGLGDLDELLAYHLASSVPMFTAANNGPIIQPVTPPTFRDALNAYARGDTLFIPSVHRRWKPIAALCRGIEKQLRHPSGATMVVSPSNAVGLSPHYDATELFVLQLEGEKTWKLYEPFDRLPLDGCSIEDQVLQSLPSKEVHLRAGDTLYVPRGFPHHAFTSENPSIHLSVYVNVFSWRDLLQNLLNAAGEAQFPLRRAIPLGFVASGQSVETLRATIEGLLQGLLEPSVLENGIERLGKMFIQNLETFPGDTFEQIDEVSKLTLDSTVEKRLGVVAMVTTLGGTASIQFPGARVDAPISIEGPMRFICEKDRFRISELPGELSDQSKLTLVRRLVREGLLRRVL